MVLHADAMMVSYHWVMIYAMLFQWFLQGYMLCSGIDEDIFLFFTAPRSESVWGSYDWICVARIMPFCHIRVTDFLL